MGGCLSKNSNKYVQQNPPGPTHTQLAGNPQMMYPGPGGQQMIPGQPGMQIGQNWGNQMPMGTNGAGMLQTNTMIQPGQISGQPVHPRQAPQPNQYIQPQHGMSTPQMSQRRGSHTVPPPVRLDSNVSSIGRCQVHAMRQLPQHKVPQPGIPQPMMGTPGSAPKHSTSSQSGMSGSASSQNQIAKTDPSSRASGRSGSGSGPTTQQQMAGGPASVRSVHDSPSRSNKLFIAMFDYNCQTEDDLAFAKGELMEVESTMGEWWMATHCTSKKRGYIPSNYVEAFRSHRAETWFMEDVTRLSAECMLREYSRGTFLVRNAESRSNEFSLSVRDSQEVKHYRIRVNDDGHLFIAKRSPFKNLVELIEHYKQHGDGLCVKLTVPIDQGEGPTRTLQSLSKTHEVNWEIQHDQLEFGIKLGSGQFGEVFKGSWMKSKEVAIKTLKAGTMDKEDFRRESNIMKKLKHKNLVALYGVCMEPLLIVTELAKYGNLLDFFKRSESRLIFKDLVMMGANVAAGMHYLERQGYVHRDLAARNVLVHKEKPIICKIGDFGLARKLTDNLYDAHQGAKFPIKWTAPEAATKNVFTTKSDVWSFGVLFFEICTKGRQPYAGMTNADVLREVERGYRMPKLDCIEKKAYDIMGMCWKPDPNKRPTFEALQHILDDYYTSNEGENYNDDMR